MRFAIAAAALSLVFAVPCTADDSLNPHRMVDAEGKADLNKCAVCHTETLELSRSKSETCTLCHSETQHAGAHEHLRAKPDAVASALSGETAAAANLPLSETGAIYCATCHLYHDPALSTDKPLPVGRSGDTTPFARAVRESLRQRLDSTAERRGVSGTLADFPAQGTTALRLSVDDGALCRTCHEGYGK